MPPVPRRVLIFGIAEGGVAHPIRQDETRRRGGLTDQERAALIAARG